MSLLDKATIITTPTAHSNGKLHSIKGGSIADFDVVRGSAATRVNAEGLIEDISVLSGELVTNGDFSNGSTGWGLGTGWSVVDGKVVADGTDSGVSGWLRQNDVITPSKKYKATFDITTNDSGVVLKINDSVSDIANIEGSGSKTIYFTSTGNHIAFSQITGKTASVTNVSVKEVIDATNIPRIDYTTGEGVILTEPQSTNLVTYSEDFSGASWSKGRISVTPNTVMSPDGSINASTLSVINATGGEEYMRVQSNDANEATCSFYVKKGNWRYIALRSVNASVFDFDTETFTFTGTNEIVSFEKLQNGWYRLKASSLTRIYCSIGFAANAITPSGGSGVNGTNMYIWGAQLEALPYSTSYIPTSGAIATRLADVVSGAGDATTFNSTEGVLYAEIAALADDGTFRFITLNDGTANNTIRLYFSNAIYGRVMVGGAEQCLFQTTSYNLIDYNKIAIQYSENNFKMYVNGNQVGTTDTGGSTFPQDTIDDLSFHRGDSQFRFDGKTKTIAVFSEALTDEELTCLTTI